jgi:hypothetical protein
MLYHSSAVTIAQSPTHTRLVILGTIGDYDQQALDAGDQSGDARISRQRRGKVVAIADGVSQAASAHVALALTTHRRTAAYLLILVDPNKKGALPIE